MVTFFLIVTVMYWTHNQINKLSDLIGKFQKYVLLGALVIRADCLQVHKYLYALYVSFITNDIVCDAIQFQWRVTDDTPSDIETESHSLLTRFANNVSISKL